MNAPLLELRKISKSFGSARANDVVDLDIHAGEIHALLGENGAGKSTLMKIIYGISQPDSGKILIDGKQMTVQSPGAAKSLGIGMVFQHFTLFESLTVAENVALSMPASIGMSEMADRISAAANRYGLDVDPRRLVHGLSVGEKQQVEIIKCLLQNPRLIILDEPTAVLAPAAIASLFKLLRQLRSEGKAIIFISHKLDEVKSLCDQATILRAGKVAGVCRPAAQTVSELARLMIGGSAPVLQKGLRAPSQKPCLEVQNLTSVSPDPFLPGLTDVELTVHSGEIVGVAGVSGNGQALLLELLSGERKCAPPSAIKLSGREIGGTGPLGRRRLGISYVPEERLGHATVSTCSLIDNALLTAHHLGMVRGGFLRPRAAASYASRCVESFDVRGGGISAVAKSFSGGNLQKFIIARELLQEPKLLVVAQPTWGVDVAAAISIRQRLIEARDRGMAIIVVSEDIDELFEISDVITVMSKGRLSRPMPVGASSKDEIGLLLGGSKVGGVTADGDPTGAIDAA